MNLKKMTNVAVLTALATLLMNTIVFPIIPGMPFLLYDPGDIPLLIISFLYGPVYAVVATLISSIIMALGAGSGGGPAGVIMHFIASGTLVIVAGMIYRAKHNKKGAVIGLISGSLAMTAIMIPANLIITPFYMGVPYQEVVKLILPGILPFNLAKAFINSFVTFFVYKQIANFLREKGLLGKTEPI